MLHAWAVADDDFDAVDCDGDGGVKAWTAAPPKMREVAELPDDRRPALVSTALSSQDGAEPVDEPSSDEAAEFEQDELLESSGS
jgi:hypothetical protein